MGSHERNSEIAVLEAMSSLFVPPPEYQEAKAAMTEIVTNVAVRKDAELPWGEKNRVKCRAVLIHGLSRTGKTELAEHLASEIDDMVAVDGTPIAHRSMLVECPSSFKQTLLFNLIVQEMMGGMMKRPLPHDAAYLRIESQLPVHRPTLLVLDEFQYAANPKAHRPAVRDGMIAGAFGFIRHMLDHATWPLPIVLVGLPEIEDVLDQPGQTFFDEKITRIRVAPMIQGSTAEIATLTAALASFCDDAGIENAVVDKDFFKRLIHATGNARGLALELCQTSVMRAWHDKRRPLQMADFAARYQVSTRAPDDQNPFIIEGWHNTDRSRLSAHSQMPDAAKTKRIKT